MRSIHWLSALVLVGCGANHSSPFDTGDDSGTDAAMTGADGAPPPAEDAGCPFCGVDASGDGSTACNPDPANYDIPGNGCDDDGDGIIDNPQGLCDTGLPTTSPSAAQFAQSIGICPDKGTTWGVTSATYTQGVGSTKAPMAQQYGTLAKFGTNVPARQGAVLGLLSTGVAADEDCGDGQDKGNTCSTTGAGSPPPGYPKAASGCPGSTVANDVVNVVLQVKVPANAKGFTFDFNFYSGEWPEWVCTDFNDSFVAWLTSSAWMGKSGDYNISFDTTGNPVSVNNNFFQACSPSNATVGCDGTTTKTDACSLGNMELQGTGFYISGDNECGQTDSGGGATGWLTTQAPVTPGETITLQFMIWNTGDQAYDSSVLIDNWQWVPSATSVSTTRPPS